MSQRAKRLLELHHGGMLLNVVYCLRSSPSELREAALLLRIRGEAVVSEILCGAALALEVTA